MKSRLLIAVALALGALVALAAPAAAHTDFEASVPANGSRLDAPPREVKLEFSGPVEVVLGGVRVVDAAGDPVAIGVVDHPAGTRSSVTIDLPMLRSGGYVVSWRVVSADGHPLQGVLSFTVGEAQPVSEGRMVRLLEEEDAGRTVAIAYGVSRTLAFASMLVLLGGVAFVVLVWPAGAANSRFRRLAWSAFAVFVVASLTNLVLQGGYAAGLALGDTLSASAVRDVLRTRFGRVYELRMALLVVAGGLLWVLTRRAEVPRWWRWPALVVGVGIAATPGLAGHAAVGSHQPYAFFADVVHVSAASVWLGGLVVVLVAVLRQPDAAAIVPRYSRLAFYAVAVVIATGLFQSWRQVGTLDALRTTDFGQSLIVKMVLVAAVLVVAFASRRVVRRGWDSASPSRLRRTVGVEAVIAVAVIGVTSLLVNAVPAKSAAAAPQSGELVSGALLVDYTVSPGRVGRNEIHLYTLTKAGQPQSVDEMKMTLSMRGRDVAPIDVGLENAGPGHFRSSRLNIPFSGRWTITVEARTSEIDRETFRGIVRIR